MKMQESPGCVEGPGGGAQSCLAAAQWNTTQQGKGQASWLPWTEELPSSLGEIHAPQLSMRPWRDAHRASQATPTLAIEGTQHGHISLTDLCIVNASC